MNTPINPIYDIDVDRLSERALLCLRLHGTKNDRDVGNWAMQKKHDADMLELHNITMILEDPRNCIGSHFGLKHIGILTEFFDIILGLNPGFIHREWKFYDQWRTAPDGKYPYTYGQILHHMEHPTARYDFSQWGHTVSKLKRNLNTRHAGMFCWDVPCHERDFVPCTYGFHFQLIDGKLCMTTMMRSQDALKGWFLDCFLYSNLLMMMADELDLEVGHYTVFQNNFHVYPSDLTQLEKQLDYYSEYDARRPKGSLCPKLTEKDNVAIYRALDNIYTSVEEGEPIYNRHYLEDIGNEYLRALVALIYTKYITDVNLREFLVNEQQRMWYERIRREQNVRNDENC